MRLLGNLVAQNCPSRTGDISGMSEADSNWFFTRNEPENQLREKPNLMQKKEQTKKRVF